MSKSEYHLLYVLSEPPVPVAQKNCHGWKTGDVLSAPQNPTFSSSDRFVVLDVSRHGRALTLKISEISINSKMPAGFLVFGPKELELSEPIFDSGTMFSVSLG